MRPADHKNGTASKSRIAHSQNLCGRTRTGKVEVEVGKYHSCPNTLSFLVGY